MRELNSKFGCLLFLLLSLQCVSGTPWKYLHPFASDLEGHNYGIGQNTPTKVARGTGRGINPMMVIRQYILDHPKIVDRVRGVMYTLSDESFQAAANERKSTWVCPEPGPTLCPTPSPPSPGTANPLEDQPLNDFDMSLGDKWELLHNKIIEDPEGCQSCIDTWDAIRDLACGSTPWETLRDIIINLCEASFVEDSDPVMCNGTITLQGQHLYCIVQEATSRDICESLNSCYPPDTRDRLPVSERTPWAVSSRQESESKKDSTKAKRKDVDGLVMVAQLTDIHVQQNHVVGGNSDCPAYVCCIEGSLGSGSAREYGEYKCNLPPKTLDLFLDRVKEANPDFVVYAGDAPPHTMWDETRNSQLNCSQLLADSMYKSFGQNMRVYPNIGNHELYPTNLYSLRMDDTKVMTEEFTKMWHKFAGLDLTGNQTMTNLGYYTTTVPGHPKLRIMSINTNYDWYNMNFYNVLNQNTPELEQHNKWVKTTLESARSNDEKVLIVAHHPVGGPDSNVRSARWWEEVANQYGDVIGLHVSGHTHQNHFRLSLNHTTMEAQSVNLVLTSTTTNTNINPTMRMYYLDPANAYSLVDFEDFYLDISTQEDSIGVPPAIAFSYSAAEEYGLSDLSPESWKDLVIRFTKDDELFQKFYNNFRSRSNIIGCDYDCKVAEICEMWFSEISEVDECVTLAPPAPTQPPVNPTVAGAGQPASGLVTWTVVLLGFVSNFVYNI